MFPVIVDQMCKTIISSHSSSQNSFSLSLSAVNQSLEFAKESRLTWDGTRLWSWCSITHGVVF